MTERTAKRIVKASYGYVILIPVYYDHEIEPSYRKVFSGTESECKEIFPILPDEMKATYEENRQSRTWKYKEMVFITLIKHFSP